MSKFLVCFDDLEVTSSYIQSTMKLFFFFFHIWRWSFFSPACLSLYFRMQDTSKIWHTCRWF